MWIDCTSGDELNALSPRRGVALGEGVDGRRDHVHVTIQHNLTSKSDKRTDIN